MVAQNYKSWIEGSTGKLENDGTRALGQLRGLDATGHFRT